MKHHLLLPALAMALLPAFRSTAQTGNDGFGLKRFPTEKGSYLLGANLVNAAAGFGKGATASYYSLNASPRAGYFLTDNFALGATINGAFQKSGDFRNTAYGGGVFARYYFGRTTDKAGNLNRLRFFGEAGLNRTIGNSRLESPGNPIFDQRYKATTVYGIGGINYFLSSSVALEVGLSYQRTLQDRTKPGLNQNQLGLNIGLQIFIPRSSKHRQPRLLPQE